MIFGDVLVKSATVSQQAAAGQYLNLNDSITTGKDSIADLTFGTTGVIRVSPDTDVLVSSLVSGTSDKTTLDMKNGNVLCTFAKLKKTEFQVKTPTAVAGIRGTSFSVTSGADGASMKVISGTIRVNPVSEGKIVENISTDVPAGNKTELITEESVKKIIETQAPVETAVMTTQEIEETKVEVQAIKIEEFKDLNDDVKNELRNKISKETEKVETPKPAVDTAKINKENALKKQRQLEQEKLAAENAARAEAEAKKLEEERKAIEKTQRVEKRKKDRASNIPSI
jgi:hypothetical protein